MKTRYYTATTINGFIADANHSLTWLFQFPDLDSQKNDYPEFIERKGLMRHFRKEPKSASIKKSLVPRIRRITSILHACQGIDSNEVSGTNSTCALAILFVNIR